MVANNEKLSKIMKELRLYLDELEKAELPNGILRKEVYRSGAKDKEAYYLEGNKSALVSVALRVLYVASLKEGHYHLDSFSGELTETSEELIIAKAKKKGSSLQASFH